MAKIDFKIRGIEELQMRLNKKKLSLEKRLVTELRQLGEDSVTFSKENKGYKDRTSNLKNSISYALFKDGELVEISVHVSEYRPSYKTDTGITKSNPISQSEIRDMAKNSLMVFASKEGIVKPKGYTLIVVAGMIYGKNVEDKGYNVLYLTENYLKTGLRNIMNDIIEDIVSS